MLSVGTVKFLRRVIRATRLVGSQPYKWPLNGEMEFISSRSRYIIYLAQLLLFCAYQSFIFGRWIHAVFLDIHSTPKTRVGLQYVACSYMVPLTFQLITFFNYGRHQGLVKRLLRHCRLFDDSKLYIDNLRNFGVNSKFSPQSMENSWEGYENARVS